ncbi:PX domain protein [Terfezia boudieri ATCC MYA-4762]|uniref:PX domain protein n=1 Tax=Terfezia boudieri ATCC MYA-4762 TaxID=1051890 RepID=A0A3N4LXK3_9PEZI|nr:PX domain protein [Terfezia boudieri ATCC MYA-4762]
MATCAVGFGPQNVAKFSLGRKPILTGKQEHYLKRELISQQVKWEISELSSPTALQRFGAPFRSDKGEVAPEDSELPILRYLFVHHVRNFPFLDQAKEKEFWQERLQVFLESFAIKRISSSEDRLEETKRRKLALKAQKVVELMMVSGIPTASGYEERIRFEEMEVVERGASEEGLLVNVPEGHYINGWGVNVCTVREIAVKRHIKSHPHAEFLIRIKQEGKPDIVVGRRYGAFIQLDKDLRHELPGKALPSVPRKETSSQTAVASTPFDGDDDSGSVSSFKTFSSSSSESQSSYQKTIAAEKSHARTPSRASGFLSAASNYLTGSSSSASVNNVAHESKEPKALVLWRETQRISLRAYLRALLANPQVAKSKTIRNFLLKDPIVMNEAELADEKRRKEMDVARIEEQKNFFQIAQKRARELDVYMEGFRRDVVERNGLTRLFAEIKRADKLENLSVNYKKFAEWLRIEVAATIYHIFLAEDNSPEVFAQAKRIHSLIPYTLMKNVLRIANPAMVMSGFLDIFLATPFNSRSLMQRILGMALNDGLEKFQKSIDALTAKVGDPALCEKIKHFVDADEPVRDEIKHEAEQDSVDLLVAILRSEYLQPALTTQQIEKIFNAYVAWTNALDNEDEEMRHAAIFFAHLKQLLKLYTRQRDKSMMLRIIEEPVTLKLFKDLFLIFYEPLIRVYKSANVYNSVTDFAVFVDDTIKVVEKAQRQALSADPNQTVQAFIDLCTRHEENFYKFVHEVHIHDNGLFDKLMGWLEGILQFLREGPGKSLDINQLFEDAVKSGKINETIAKKEIDSLIGWQAERKKWHEQKTRQKMAGSDKTFMNTGADMFQSSDFGIDEDDLEDLAYVDDESSEEDTGSENSDILAVERERRVKAREALRRRSGEPEKPQVKEILKMTPEFLVILRQALA